MTALKFLIAFVCIIAATSNPLDTRPSQVHIALAGNDGFGNSNGMAVSYHTKIATTATFVKYGVKSHVYTNTVEGSQSSYYETFHHHTVLTSLRPSTTYYYQVGSDEDGWSKEFHFQSAPKSESLRGNYTFAFFADLGSVNGEYSIGFIDQIKDNIDLIIHGGDVGYADDSFLHPRCVTNFCYESAYNDYMNGIESWASQVPYMVAPGNHEAECHDPSCLLDKSIRDKLSNFTAYNARFRMPSLETNGALNMHYSFNYGNAHFISLDTETGYPGAPEEHRYVLPCGGFAEQLNWLEQDLIQANKQRSLRPWIFVQGHHPMYQGNSVNTELQTAVEELFFKYGVDVFFTGHKHFYERNLPVYKGVPEQSYANPKATTHVLVGGAGCDEMHHVQQYILDPSTGLTTPNEGAGLWKGSEDTGPWTVVTDLDEHVGVSTVDIVDDSTLVFKYIRTTTGEVFDSFTLTRDHSVYAAAFKA